jgi:Bacterial Ig domain
MTLRPRTLMAILALSAPFAIAQTSSPVAYIYVSSNYNGSNNRVVGYAAAADGTLTQISGSPWADNLTYLATNGAYLFGSTNIPNDEGKNVFSYAVESNGALKYIGATNIQDNGADNACNFAENSTLDHTGSYLYLYVENAGGCNGDSYGAYQSFAVNKSTGLLNYLGVTNTFPPANTSPLTILADNEYAYSEGYYDDIAGFEKASNGSLSGLSSPTANVGSEGEPSGWGWNYGAVAADTTNHLAVDVCYSSAGGAYGCSPDTEDKIATFTINTSNGSQSTNSNFSNMPTTEVQYVDALAMSPSGTLLAVGGQNGIQIFSFNPNGQATAITGLITTAPIPVAYAASALYWDNSNHLYEISNSDNALHVFTVTATGATEAPGSPYSIQGPVALTGHSLSSSTSGACSAPSGDGVNVCSPAEDATVSSPVEISAAAMVSGGVYRFELWNGDTKLLSSDNGTMDQSLSLAPGTYTLTFDAYNSGKTQHEYATRDITVQ